MHDIFSGISDERVTDVIARPGVAAINSQAAGRRKVAGSASAGFDSLFQPLDTPLGAHHPPRLLRADAIQGGLRRSEEHTSELQSRLHLVCRLLLEKKKITRSGSWKH